MSLQLFPPGTLLRSPLRLLPSGFLVDVSRGTLAVVTVALITVANSPLVTSFRSVGD